MRYPYPSRREKSSASSDPTAPERRPSCPSSPPSSGRTKAAWRSSASTPKKTHAVRERINISSGNPNFPWSLTVRENLNHSAMLYGLYGRDLARSVDEAISAFELEAHADSKFETLSTGTKQRVSLAKSILNRPEILFLDEPTSGLDPDMALKTRALIKKIYQEQEITVVLTTHYMPEAEELCDRIAFLRGEPDRPRDPRRAEEGSEDRASDLRPV